MRRLLRHLLMFCSALSLPLFVVICLLWARSYSSYESVRIWLGGEMITVHIVRGAVVLDTVEYPRSQSDTSWLYLSRDTPAPVSDQNANRVLPAHRMLGFGHGWPRPTRSIVQRARLQMQQHIEHVNPQRIYRPGFYVWRRVAFPLWLCALLSGIAPIFWAVRSARRRGRDVQGLCPACGYDLRATPERCPECGTSAATKAVRA